MRVKARHRVEAVAAKLSDNKVKMTPQRVAILEDVLSLPGHFSAEDLWYAMRGRGRVVSRATVYRFLATLLRAGVLREVPLGEGHAHYEIAEGRQRHEHLVCTACGRVIEFERPDVQAAVDQACRDHGFACTGYRFEVFGLCSSCWKSKAAVGSPGPASRPGRAGR
ncbi:MAG: transcriptional repressor [Armatimonadetes bacterium]|nr:transcriptional repressor [Armatimonadota bacterium]